MPTRGRCWFMRVGKGLRLAHTYAVDGRAVFSSAPGASGQVVLRDSLPPRGMPAERFFNDNKHSGPLRYAVIFVCSKR